MRVKKSVIIDRISIILAALAAFWIGLLAFTVHAGAVGSGEISVTFPKEAIGAGLTLYEVADVQEGSLVFREPFQGTDLTLSDLAKSAKVETAAVQLTDTALKNGVSGTSVTVDSSGTVLFENLEPALYLLAQTNGLDHIQIQNTLVPVPYTGEDGAPVYHVEVEPKYSLPGTGTLKVTKRVTDLDENLVVAVGAKFYVALFADESCTQRVTDVKALEFEGVSANTAVFQDLRLDIPYYVGETDENGILLESGVVEDAVFTPVYPDSQVVNLSVKKPEAEFAFNNAFLELPDGFYYEGELTVTKKVLKGSNAFATDQVFYAGVFTDQEHTELYGDLIELNMAGNSEVSVTVPVYIGDAEGDSVTYYVAETDSQGNPLSQGADLGFTFQIDQDSVVFKPGEQTKNVTITNTYPEETGSEEKPSVTPGPTGGKSNQSAVKTGDDTPIALYVLLAVLAFVIAVGIFFYRKSRNTGRKK